MKTKINMLWLSQVILHTYIDGLRVDDDREINHHGKSVKANSNKIILIFSKNIDCDNEIGFVFTILEKYKNSNHDWQSESDTGQHS